MGSSTWRWRWAILCSCLGWSNQALAQTVCERLRESRLPAAEVTRAVEVEGACRIAITLRPSPDSEIKSEVWLPVASKWNGKFLAVGGGGFVGSVNTAGMSYAVSEGYATAATDTGHSSPDGSFAAGHPEKLIDFAYRAVHETTVKAKAIIHAYYGKPARLSYWQGCSTGGRQGLMEAERYPEDYDGIIAGAPANNQINLCAWRMALMVAVLKDPARALPAEKTALVNKAVLAACDALDGVTDGLLEDPRKCRFDPGVLQCRGEASDGCLTAPQVETVRMAYSDLRRSNGELIYPGLPPGGETNWRLSQQSTEPGSIDLGMFRYIGRQDPAWDWRRFNVEPDLALAQKNGGAMHAVSADLSKFHARGGKLLIYHGWGDGGSGGAISPLNTIRYYERLVGKSGDWVRLFLVPGMAHCGGGTGPNQFNALAALERWREGGVAPDAIPAARVVNGRVDMTRPLCVYPKQAIYQGSGSTNDWGNFVCRVR